MRSKRADIQKKSHGISPDFINTYSSIGKIYGTAVYKIEKIYSIYNRHTDLIFIIVGVIITYFFVQISIKYFW